MFPEDGMKKTLLLMFVACMCVAVAEAGVISLVTTRVGSDTVNWAQLGPDDTPISNPFSAVSTGGIAITGRFNGGGTGSAVVEGATWTGNFTLGDALVWTTDLSGQPGQGPLSLAFSKSLNEIGAQIQADFFGAFTARLDAYNGATWLDLCPNFIEGLA